MSAPIFWIIIPAIISILLLLYQNKPLKRIIFVGICLILAIIPFIVLIDPIGDPSFFQISMDSTLNILGRSFIITQQDLFLVQLLYFFNAFWAGFTIIFKKQTRIIPLGLLFTPLLLAAYSVTPFMYSALIIEIAVIISIPIMVSKDSKSTRGIMRFLIYQSLALPFILLAGWFLAGGEITPVNLEQLVQATLLLGLGFVLWLGVFPFHSWLSMLFDGAELIDVGYILQILLIVLLLLVLRFINGFPWLREYVLIYDAAQLLGTIMVIIGSVGFFFEKRIRKVSGYFLIHSLGNLLLSIGVFQAGDIFIFSSLIASFLINYSLFIIALGDLTASDADLNLSGNNLFKNNIVFVCIAFASLSLAGMPLTLGFPSNQVIYQILAERNNAYFLLLLVSKMIITFAVFNWSKDYFQKGISLNSIIPKTTKAWILTALLLLITISGIFPQIIFNNFRDLVIGFENLIQ